MKRSTSDSNYQQTRRGSGTSSTILSSQSSSNLSSYSISSSPSASASEIPSSLSLFELIHYHYERWRSRYFIAGFHYFLTGMRVILQRFYQLTASYSNQYDLNYRWKQIYTKQEKEWDCGVACCAMVLKWANQDHSNPYSHLYYSNRPHRQEDQLQIPTSPVKTTRPLISLSSFYQHEITMRGTPLWTVDLLLCLIEHKMNVVMYTTSIGIQSHHENYEWYKRYLEEDKQRMVDQLQRLQDVSQNVIQMGLDIKDIQLMLRDEKKTVAIILIDSLTLSGRPASLKYLGHYILLMKYDPAVDEFYYFNPAIPTGLQKISSKRLNEARLHPATDEDIIFVHRSN